MLFLHRCIRMEFIKFLAISSHSISEAILTKMKIICFNNRHRTFFDIFGPSSNEAKLCIHYWLPHWCGCIYTLSVVCGMQPAHVIWSVNKKKEYLFALCRNKRQEQEKKSPKCNKHLRTVIRCPMAESINLSIMNTLHGNENHSGKPNFLSMFKDNTERTWNRC